MFARIAVVAASAALAVPLLAGAAAATTATPSISDGAGQPSENASCLAQERATRNSAGGDREKGAFGPEQADAAQTYSPYGQGLKSGGWVGGSCGV